MRRTNWKTVSTLIAMIVIAGCQDRVATAPDGVNSGVAPARLAPEERPHLSLGDIGNPPSNTSADFTVPQGGGTFIVGGNAVIFPANSICDPNTSGYGPDTWDQPCSPAKGGVAIHAEVRTAKSGTWVDFSPALRFVPSNNPMKWVWFFMYNPNAAGSGDVSNFTIKYSQSIGDPGVDDALSDASMRTYFQGALLMRRIKHFSGYTSSGRACDPATDADCTPDNGGGGGVGDGH